MVKRAEDNYDENELIDLAQEIRNTLPQTSMLYTRFNHSIRMIRRNNALKNQ
jgi:hypothetical protein